MKVKDVVAELLKRDQELDFVVPGYDLDIYNGNLEVKEVPVEYSDGNYYYKKDGTTVVTIWRK